MKVKYQNLFRVISENNHLISVIIYFCLGLHTLIPAKSRSISTCINCQRTDSEDDHLSHFYANFQFQLNYNKRHSSLPLKMNFSG